MTFPELHVRPQFDLVDHEEDAGCPCEPERLQVNREGKPWWVFLHSAVDDPDVAWGGEP